MAAPDLPESLAANPILGGWVRIGSDGVVQVRSGKVELGQGVLTALAQIAAEELDVDGMRVQMIPAATDLSPDEGYTAGSRSIQNSGPRCVRCAPRRGPFTWTSRRPNSP